MRLAPAALLLLAPPAATQIVTENAGVGSPELFVVRELAGAARSAHLDEQRWVQQLVWAPDRAHEFKLTVPVLWRDATFDGPTGALDADAAGLGDVTLRFKQALSRADDVMRSDRWALLLELGAPTGASDDTVGGVEVPPTLQLGTGAWSFGAGGAGTWIRDRQRAALEGFYRHRTSHDGTQLGDALELNAAWWYRLRPSAFRPEDEGPEIRGVVELLSSYTFASEEHGSEADDEGTLVWLAPGIHVYPGASVLFEANVQVPLYQDIDDDLGDRRWSANLIVKFLF